MMAMCPIKVIPGEVDDTQVESSKPVGAISAADKEVRKATNKSGGSQASKAADKNPTREHSRLCLEHKMVLSVTVKASLPRDARTNI